MGIIKYLFTTVGFGMLIGGFFAYQNTQSFIEKATSTEGVVTELIRSRSSDSESYYYKPVFTFTTLSGESIEIISSTGSNPPSYSEGEIVKVLYLQSEPQSARIDGFASLWLLPLILGAMGGIFFLVGISILLFSTLQKRKEKYLLKHGQQIQTKFQSVEKNHSLEVNGKNPYCILTQWQNPETSELHIFKSGNIWFDPSDFIKEQNIKVFIERNNPKKYFVDISFLPKIAS